MPLHLWYGPYDDTLPWRTTASGSYDELVDDLAENWSVFQGIHVRKLPGGSLQFYSYVLRDLPPGPLRARALTEGNLQTMRTGLV